MSKIQQLEKQLAEEKQKAAVRFAAKKVSRAKKLCDRFVDGDCKFGDKCHYKHSEEEAVVAREKKAEQKAKAAAEKLEYDRITDLVKVEDGVEPKLTEVGYSQMIKPLEECKKVVEAVQDDTFKRRCLAKFREKIYVSLDEVMSGGYSFVDKQIKEIKMVLSEYIWEKYRIETLEYFKMWAKRYPTGEGFRSLGTYHGCPVYIGGKLGHKVSCMSSKEMLPRDDVLIAAYALDETCKVERKETVIYRHAN
jgi:hypothetical protein